MISLITCISISTQILQQEILSFPQCYTHFLYIFLSDCCPFTFYPKSPLSFVSLPSFIVPFLALIFTAVLLPAKFSKIFSFTLLISSPPLSWNFDFWGLFVLFRLSHLHSMWQSLGKNPIINAETKIFNLLACFGSFLWFQASPRIHTWIICAPFLG